MRELVRPAPAAVLDSISKFSGVAMENDKESTGQLTRQLICAALGVSESTIQRAAQAGQPLTPVGGAYA